MQPDDILVIGIPVFSGRIPTPCLTQIKSLQGSHTPAIAVAVYGNRDYDDACWNCKIFEQQDSAQSVQQRSLLSIPSLQRLRRAAGCRGSLKKLTNFQRLCAERLKKLARILWKPNYKIKGESTLPGDSNVSHQAFGEYKMYRCGVCARICPVHAIDSANPRKTDRSLCISCTACIDCLSTKRQEFSTSYVVP